MITKAEQNKNIDLLVKEISGDWNYECTLLNNSFRDESYIRNGTMNLSPERKKLCISIKMNSRRESYKKRKDSLDIPYRPAVKWYSGPKRDGYIESDILTIQFYSKIDKCEGEITIPLTSGRIDRNLEGEFTFRQPSITPNKELEGVIVLEKKSI